MDQPNLRPLHNYQLIDLVRIWSRCKKQIFFFTLACGLLSIIISLILPEYFKSRTILYPISMTMADRNMIFGQQQGQAEFSYFGNKYDASRILQVANSSEVIDYIINKYDLKTHYKFKEEFLDNYHALKNDKDAIEITLLDTDKEKCAQMVNDIATKIDEIATKPVTEGKTKIIKMLEVELKNKNNELFSASSPANKDNLTSEIKQLSEALTQYKVSNNDKFSSITILEKAAASEKKTKPVRWLIVTLSILGGFFFSLLAAVVVNQISHIRKSL